MNPKTIVQMSAWALNISLTPLFIFPLGLINIGVSGEPREGKIKQPGYHTFPGFLPTTGSKVNVTEINTENT